jgi:hypothetical protein
LLYDAGARILGVALNDVNIHKDGYGYGYYNYGYGYGYGQAADSKPISDESDENRT